jgi:UDP-N-acetylglucosamine diphosphorylase/glucosamine-1-phosphate N-acetyltransferase
MKKMDLILYDDAVAQKWWPFTLTRPAGELLHGAFTMRERAEQRFNARCLGHLTTDALREFDEPDAAPVLAAGSIGAASDRLFFSSRAIPAWQDGFEPGRSPASLRIGDEIVGHYCPAGTAAPTSFDQSFERSIELKGRTLRNFWELMSHSAEQVTEDVVHAKKDALQPVPDGVSVIGKPALALGSGVRFEPGVVLDFTDGPICLDDGVTVRAFTRLAGPAYVGRQSTLLGGPYTAVSIGPLCKVHGEMEETVVLGYSNKAHDGFLGHAYLGRWVNLGAMTTNSDLKNNYGSVRLWTPDGEVDTKEMKIGCFLGDHVKTGIGALLNTGTVVGPGSNLYGTDQPPKYVPAFSWGSGSDLVEYRFDKFISTAETVMARRKITLSDKQRRLLETAWKRGRSLSGKGS